MTTLASWPVEDAGLALVALASAAGLPMTTATPPRSLGARPSATELATFIEHAALAVGLEAEPLESFVPDLDAFLDVAGPALFVLGSNRLLAAVRCSRRTTTVLDRDGTLRTVPTRALESALLEGSHAETIGEIARLLDGLGLSPKRRAKAERELLRQRLGRDVAGTCFSLRQPIGAPLRDLARREGLAGLFGGLVLVRALEMGAAIAAWTLVGRGALEGRFDAGWLVAWALVLFTQIPLRAVAGTLQGRLAVGFGALLKRRLVLGSLQMNRDAIGNEGVGALLGRVLESEQIEALAESGGFAAITAGLGAMATLVVLAVGAAPIAGCAVFLAWLVLVAVLCVSMHHARERWTGGRVAMTHSLVENIVGHRTRLAQGRGRIHAEEDAALGDYVADSSRLDRWTVLVRTFVPAGWFVTGIVALGPAFVRGADAASLAIAVGGILLGHRALARLTAAAIELSGAAVAWRRVGGLVREATLEETGAPAFVAKASDAEHAPSGGPLLELSDVTFRYRKDDEPTLSRVSLAIGKGDRILVEGPSGSGKSTLAALLAGLRQPDTGLVLMRGLDHRTLGGHGWRTGVAFAPQFHENHVLSSTFAFNLLLSRWPPSPADVDEAEAVCNELDLGPVLDRMPARMQQTVGDTGWQLSHGEKSRLYLARALLQRAALVVLDESFAALDPETMKKCVDCARKRAPALLVIAHP